MMNRIFKLAIAASAIAALPRAAHAATAPATSTATLNVVETQCTITGSNVDLGTFNTTNTWGQVAAVLGGYNGTTYTAGSKGQEHLNYGSITCENGLPYTLQIKGTATTSANAIKITIGTKTAVLAPHIKKLGGNAIADNTPWTGAGAQVHTLNVAGTGTGAAQAVLGHAPIHFTTTMTTAVAADVLGTVGSYTDTLTYTLTF